MHNYLISSYNSYLVIICLYTVRWYQLFHKILIIDTQLYGEDFSKRIGQYLFHTHMPMHAEHNNDDTIKTSGHSSLEKYTSQFIERVVCERGVGYRTKTATYWPHNSSGYHSLSFPFSWAAQPGAWGPSLCEDMILIPESSLRLIWTSRRRGYIKICRSLLLASVTISHSIQPFDSQGRPWSPDIFDRMHLLFTQVHFFFWQLGRVGGQYATYGLQVSEFELQSRCYIYFRTNTLAKVVTIPLSLELWVK